MACTPDAGAGEADDELERVDVCLRVEDLEKRSVVCAVLPAKNASVLLGLLSEHLPIPELRFLKRVRGARPGVAEGLLPPGKRASQAAPHPA